MPLRPYQQAAFDAASSYIKKCLDPCVIEAATGAGKSHIIAALAEWIYNSTSKRVLCLAPSKELVEQNAEKYRATGNPCSLFSASAGQKSLRNHVVFGSPLTVKNALERFKSFGAVIVDEAHGITPTIKAIIDDLRTKNPRLRVIGLTATPYRLNDGYIYALDENGKPVGEDKTADPYFKRLVYRITAHELIEMGFLTPPVAEGHDGYETSHLELDKTGHFDAHEVEQAFEGHGRLTSQIVSEVVTLSRQRKGVMLFAATRKHAAEIMASLPQEKSALITGETPKKERERIIRIFKQQRIKYLVSIGTLTTGFDASHVDVIAILRATESASLLQQIIGRGLRLGEDKKDCLVLDYAENIDRHCPDGDIFAPEITARQVKKGGGMVEACCPDCGTVNEFSARPNPDQFGYSADGYFIDLAGNKTETPSHHGRRCFGERMTDGRYARCGYRWTLKECEECGHENDIAARYCEKCKAEIVNPNEKLVIEYKKLKKDPYRFSVDKVYGWNVEQSTSMTSGNPVLVVSFSTEFRQVRMFYTVGKNEYGRAAKAWRAFSAAVYDGKVAKSVAVFMKHLHNAKMPETITVAKNKQTGFFEIRNYNETEEAPEL